MDVQSETFEQRHARVLAYLLPSVCHRLNNSVSVTTGMVELALLSPNEMTRTERLQVAFEQSKGSATQLKRLGTFSNRSPVHVSAEDATRALNEASDLLVSICQVSGTRFENRAGDAIVPVSTDSRRLLQLIVMLACSPLLCDAGDHPGSASAGAQLRLSLRPHPRGAVMRLSMRPVDLAEAAATGELLSAPAAELGASLSTRSLGNATCHRLVLPSC